MLTPRVFSVACCVLITSSIVSGAILKSSDTSRKAKQTFRHVKGNMTPPLVEAKKVVTTLSKQSGLSPALLLSLFSGKPSSSHNSPNKQKLTESSSGSASGLTQLSGPSSSGSTIVVASNFLPANLVSKMPSIQTLMDAAGITKLTDPLLNQARKRWNTIKTSSQIIRRFTNPLIEKMQKRKTHLVYRSYDR